MPIQAAPCARLRLMAAWLACSAGINAILIAWLGAAEEAAMQLNILALLQVRKEWFFLTVLGTTAVYISAKPKTPENTLNLRAER